MLEPRLRNAESLFNELVDLPPAERARILGERCGADEGLRSLVERLLASNDSGMAGFMTGPVPGTARPARGPDLPAQIGRYALVGELGRGGAGVVYEARQSDPPRAVALKVIGAGFGSPGQRRRFAREAEFLGNLQHPGIAQIFEAGIIALDGASGAPAALPYFAMELVRGEPITVYCDRERLTVPQRLGLFRELCVAVEHAHQKGIIHRDLKPSNVLVTVTSGQPRVKVIDFGIAKAVAPLPTDAPALTEVLQLAGTPAYMSPEQAGLSRDVDTRSDVYSLGVLLYELLTGTTPLDPDRLRGMLLPELQDALRNLRPPRPSARFAQPGVVVNGTAPAVSAAERAQRRGTEVAALVRQLRGELDWIVLKCLEQEPRLRYATVSALAEDLERFLAQRPVRARPTSAAYAARKFVQRHRAAVLAATALAVAVIAGLFGTTAGLLSALRARAESARHQHAAQASAARAEAEAARATASAAEARAANEFMRAVLTSVEPHQHGADVRLLDVLAAASATASQRFADHPRQEAQVRDLLGEVYFGLSLWTQAQGEFGKSMALWAAHAGTDDPRALGAELRYLGAALNLARIGEAERVLERVVPRAVQVFGPDDPRTLDTRRCLAITHLYRGRLDAAQQILVELRAHPRLVADDDMQIRILFNLLDTLRRRADAVPPLQRAELLRPGEPLARELLERAVRHHGRESPVTLRGELYLAELRCADGDYGTVAAMARALLDRSAQQLGDCHHLRQEALHLLAYALTRLGADREPAELQLRRIDCLRQQSAANPVTLVGALSDALPYLDRAGLAPAGESLARELASALRQYGGGHGDFAFGAELHIARFVSLQDRTAEADERFTALFEQLDRAAPLEVARLHLFYGLHLVRQGNFADAERELLRAADECGDVRGGTWESHPDDLILGFINLYEAWARPDKLAEFRRLREEVLCPSAPGAEGSAVRAP